MKLERAEYSPATITVAKVESLPHSADSSSETKKKTKNKRRFSDEQIKSLESMFESETKLEPRVKIQLARELGLHPRQIAIWFQNRRARCKSKELERDYSKLKANYDALASQFEILKKEKQSLLIQLQKLTGKPREQSRSCQIDTDGNSTDGESDNGVTKHESEQKTELSVEGSDLRVVAGSDDDNSKNNMDYFGQEEEEDLTSFIEPAEQVLASSSVNWCSFDSSGFFDQSGSSAQWWEIWS